MIVRAQSKSNPAVYQDFVLDILEDNFKTNVKDVKVFAGDWHADGESLKVENHGSNDIYMAADKMPYENYQMDLDIKYGRGIVNIFFASGNQMQTMPTLSNLVVITLFVCSASTVILLQNHQ